MKYMAGHSQSFFFTPDLSPDPLLTKLQELADLPDGWRFGEGISPQPAVLHKAEEIYQLTASLRLRADAFPGADGSLSLVFYVEERCVEIHISRNGKINLCVEEGEGFTFQESKDISDASVAEAVEQVLLLAQKLDRRDRNIAL